MPEKITPEITALKEKEKILLQQYKEIKVQICEIERKILNQGGDIIPAHWHET